MRLATAWVALPPPGWEVSVAAFTPGGGCATPDVVVCAGFAPEGRPFHIDQTSPANGEGGLVENDSDPPITRSTPAASRSISSRLEGCSSVLRPGVVVMT